MTTIATHQEGSAPAAPWMPPLGLSGRLIVLTMSFVMLAEIMIYIPSAVSFRRSWLNDRFMGAQMISLALAGTEGSAGAANVDAKLLVGLKATQAIAIRGRGTRWLLATEGSEPPAVMREIDVRVRSWWMALHGLARNLTQHPTPVAKILGPGVPGIEGVEWVEIVLDEAHLQTAILTFSRNFLAISLAISAFTAALLYLALHLMVVRPVRRLSGNMEAFAGNPEDGSRIVRPSGRSDEIGSAEKALSLMQTALASELRQKRHLADLGLAVSKINHELRNMLTTAQLLGDRLEDVEDPTVRRIAPRLVRTLRRAVGYCAATLAYGRASERAPQRQRVPLKPLVLEQLEYADLVRDHPVAASVDMADDLVVDADTEQLGRALLNLIRNAVDAHARAQTPGAVIQVLAERTGPSVTIRVCDNGPGVPNRIRDRIFSAFQASERSGGTGLGLPVAEELVRLHGGRITLEEASTGTCFAVTIPDRDAPNVGRRS